MRERIPLQNRLRLPLLGFASVALVLLVLTRGYRIPTPPWFEASQNLFLNILMVLFLADLVLNLVFEPDRTPWLKSHFPDLLLVPAVFFALFGGHALLGGGLVIGRECFVIYRMVARTRWFQQLPLTLQLRPTQQLALSFLFCILTGTLLLTIPAATADGRGAPIVDALFTATSAVCVTGLSIVDAGSYYSLFGQSVILVLVQIGGLGILTLSTSVALIFKRKLGLRTRALMGTLVEDPSLQRLTSLVFYIIRAALLLEGIGALVLYLRWRADFPSQAEAIFSSVFHAVAAFCNAGFSLFPRGLEPYRGSFLVNLVMIALMLMGGLGFTVLAAFFNAETLRLRWKGFRKLSVHTRLALVSTLVLLVSGALLIFFFEFDGALAPLSLKEKIMASVFQSATLRTAGQRTLDPATFQNVTLWVMILWMFIGGCPSSTAGGIKVTTAGILLLSVRAMLLGREDVELLGRSIPKEVVYKSIAIVIISVMAVTLCFSLLLVTEGSSFVGLMFESVSAFANVGLSLGVTPTLTVAGKLILVFLMYAGRIGPLTLALAVGERAARAPFHYPEARILVG
ncbi:MAG TPA: TrkH family potassium uptake protein [Candidatus Polarisedimenticolia bacterium]|nr:TrkH family potassium uptake protein [Candidatus Polarisedimenticolia bacterium]